MFITLVYFPFFFYISKGCFKHFLCKTDELVSSMFKVCRYLFIRGSDGGKGERGREGGDGREDKKHGCE